MRCSVSGFAAMLAAGNLLVAGVGILHAQTPTYAPNSPLVAPGDPGSTIPQSTIPQSTVPQSTVPSTTVPQSTIPSTTVPDGTYTIPGNGLQVPNGNTFDPAGTVVTPGTVQPNAAYGRGWYPGYWLGFRPYDPPFGGGPVQYQTNYQGFGGAPGGCSSCQPQSPCGSAPCGAAPCGPQNLDFGRGYDGFFTGW